MLLEVLIALSLLVTVTLIADSGSVVSTQVASTAKQHSVASALINQTVASAESLPFADLEAGLNPSAETLTSDSNITKSGSTYTFSLTGATLATTNTNTSEAPLVPHSAVTTIGSVAYTVAAYPSTSSSGLVTLVVIVSWASPLSHQKIKLVGETQVAAP